MKTKNRFKNRFETKWTGISGHPYRFDITARDFRAKIWARAERQRKSKEAFNDMFGNSLKQLAEL